MGILTASAARKLDEARMYRYDKRLREPCWDDRCEKFALLPET